MTSQTFSFHAWLITRETLASRAGDHLVRDMKWILYMSILIWHFKNMSRIDFWRKLYMYSPTEENISPAKWGGCILTSNRVLRNTEIRRTYSTISLSFLGIKNASSYFSFEASLVLRISVCLFLSVSQTLSWNLQRWVTRKFDQLNNIDVFTNGQIPIGFLFVNLHCALSVFILWGNNRERFREHVVW